MKRLLKILLLLIFIVGGGITILYFSYDEELPEGVAGPEADELARQMMDATNHEAWLKTSALQWEFSARDKVHKLIWDKERHFAQIEFDGHMVQVNINERKGAILSNTLGLSTLSKVELCEKAWKIWVNDSFWLNPVAKALDPGTSRKIVSNEDGSRDLLVTYSSGGATPGDSYLWILDENMRPKAWKFWVSIFPVGGLEFTWEGWTELSTGAMISTNHRGLATISINNVRGKYDLQNLTGVKDIFAPLESADVFF